MSAPSSPSHPKPSREMIHEALRGWPALHAYVLPDDQPAARSTSVSAKGSR